MDLRRNRRTIGYLVLATARKVVNEPDTFASDRLLPRHSPSANKAFCTANHVRTDRYEAALQGWEVDFPAFPDLLIIRP